MRMDFSPTLRPFDPADRPGVAKGGALSTTLSALDQSGVVYRQAKHRDALPAVSAPMNDLPGVGPSAKGAAGLDPAAQHARIEQHAKQLVSQTFFGTMLKQMRDSPFKSELFEGGRGGQAFSGLYDQKLIDQMSRGAGSKLVNAVVRKFEGRKAYANQAADNRNQERPAARTSLGANRGMAIGADAIATANSGLAVTAAAPTEPADAQADNPYRNIKIHVAPALRR